MELKEFVEKISLMTLTPLKSHPLQTSVNSMSGHPLLGYPSSPWWMRNMT